MKKFIIGLAGFGLGWLACSAVFKLKEDSYKDEYDSDYCTDDLSEPINTTTDENAEEEEETTSTETTTESNEPEALENAEEPATKTRKSRSKKADVSAD